MSHAARWRNIKPYALLRQAMQKREQYAIAKVAMQNREHIVAIRPQEMS